MHSSNQLLVRWTPLAYLLWDSLHGNVPSLQTLEFFTVAQREYGLAIVNELCIEYPDGQLGIGSTDVERGVVYIKILTWDDG